MIPGVDDLYDLLISVEVITQWSAYICTATSQLVYHPDWWTRSSLEGPRRLPVNIAIRDLPASPSDSPT